MLKRFEFQAHVIAMVHEGAEIGRFYTNLG